jgi:hypothetical protein
MPTSPIAPPWPRSSPSLPAPATTWTPPAPGRGPSWSSGWPGNGSPTASGIAGNIVLAWLITIPCAGLVGAGVERLTIIPAGSALAVALAAIIDAIALYARNRRNHSLAS